MTNDNQPGGELKRSIGLPGMVFYGVGTMIGGGFYALLGKIVHSAGVFTPLALALSGALALLLPEGEYSGLAIGLISILAGLNGALVL